MTGFKEYYDDLNKKTVEEFQKQEKQQNDIHCKVENYDKKIVTILKKVLYFCEKQQSKIDTCIEKMIKNFRENKRKSLMFIKLFNYSNRKKLNRKVKNIPKKG